VLVVRPSPRASGEPIEGESVSETVFALEPEGEHENAPAVDLIRRAAALRATDIHIDPSTDRTSVVRFRIDGRLERYCAMGADLADHLIHQLKNLAQLDITDPFHPQEGRVRLPASLSELEVRVTTAPVAAGQAMALRLFVRDNVFRPLNELGLSSASQSIVDQILRKGEGLSLVTGPTGAGKTTSVYSMLATLGTPDRNVVSVEDPVEFSVPFIRQLAVDTRHGITMTSGLRTLLRMDPDILFLGEIRDGEAAEIAMRAASSGKCVFSTLHTRDVASTVTALRDLRVDSRSLASNLTGIVNQRLVRRLCQHCRESRTTREDERTEFQVAGLDPPAQLAVAKGCSECRGTGYLGRIGVFEAVQCNDQLSAAIQREASEDEIRLIVCGAGMRNLTADALQKASEGITSYEEVREMRWY
jgi:type II secretory ATPase GspE/PulE/Tfp pilus assembly ATPase PilB-like protein